jgi:hypothetical protein
MVRTRKRAEGAFQGAAELVAVRAVCHCQKLSLPCRASFAIRWMATLWSRLPKRTAHMYGGGTIDRCGPGVGLWAPLRERRGSQELRELVA